MLKEFKAFAMRGNVVDLAVGVIIGAAFSKIVSSLIDDVLTPLLLRPALEAANLTRLDELKFLGTVKYGLFVRRHQFYNCRLCPFPYYKGSECCTAQGGGQTSCARRSPS